MSMTVIELSHLVGIVTHPQSANVTLNSVIKINCTVIATFIYWQINGLLIPEHWRSNDINATSSQVTINQTQNRRFRSLSVLGTSDSNGTNIVCVAQLGLNPSDSVRSEEALILVQGDHFNLSSCG